MQRPNAFKAPDPPLHLSRVELYRNLARRFTLSFPARWQYMPWQQRQAEATSRRSSIKASVMRSDESREFSNATEELRAAPPVAAMLRWKRGRATVNPPTITPRHVGWIFLINSPHRPRYDSVIAFFTWMPPCISSGSVVIRAREIQAWRFGCFSSLMPSN